MTRETASRQTAVIQRIYEADERVCAQALKLLLTKKVAGASHADNDGTEIKEDFAYGAIVSDRPQ